MPQVPTHHAVIDTAKGSRFVLMKLSAGGYSRYSSYRVYKYDPDNRWVVNNYIKIQAFKTPLKRYAPYLFSDMGLVAFGISAGLISPFSDSKLEQEDLDRIFIQFKEQYDSGIIDSNLFIGP